VNLSVAVEYRFTRLPDGSVWTATQYTRAFWRRYLDVFDHVRCVARVQEVARLEGEWHRCDSPEVSFCALPHYVGPAQFLQRMRRVRTAVRRSILPRDAYLLRVPGNIGTLVWHELQDRSHPYAVEVIGDPYDVFAPGAVQHPLRPFFRWHTTRQLRRQCAGACTASYVTDSILQRRYPTRGMSIGASSVELPDENFAALPRTWRANTRAAKLIFVGSLEQYYKAPDLLIRAVSRAAARGFDLRLTVLGDGRLRPALEALSARLGIRDRVDFLGEIANGRVIAQFDAADLFVLPSWTEGLPKAMIEAMGRALPCIGSDAGGIPELLAPDAIVPRGDLAALTDKLCAAVGDSGWMARMSAANLRRAREYRSAVLHERRVRFYRTLREITEQWLQQPPLAA
jgi:glycosyltransferase involved in cell wall biosynthesis